MNITQYLIISVTGSQCVENTVQVVGEHSQNEDYVIICLGGYWGKVCCGWPWINESVVVCRQLGFSTEGNK